MKRLVFGVIWTAVLPFITLVGIALLTHMLGVDPKQAGETYGAPAFLGAIVISALLSIAGILPGTRRAEQPSERRERSFAPRRKATEPLPSDADADESPRKPIDPAAAQEATAAWTKEEYGYASTREPSASRSTVMPQPPEGGHRSEYQFSLQGFFEEWRLIIPGAAMFVLIGVCMIGAMQKGKPQSVSWFGLICVLFGGGFIIYLTYRVLAVRWVRLDDEGVNWGGAFGSHHRDWDEIEEVSRSEVRVVNRNAVSKSMKLKFTDGSKVRFDQSLGDYDDLAASIQMTTGDLILQRKMQDFAEQGQAVFGPVTVSDKGVEMKGEFFPWSNLGKYQIVNGHLILYALRGRRDAGNKETRLSEIPNYPILLHFMDCRGQPK